MLDRLNLIVRERPVQRELLPVLGAQLFVRELPQDRSDVLRKGAIVAGYASAPRSLPPSSSGRREIADFLVGRRVLLERSLSCYFEATVRSSRNLSSFVNALQNFPRDGTIVKN